ncbi:MAG: 1-phosphofructokinase family hexose kinase [Anaerolineae bacterium]
MILCVTLNPLVDTSFFVDEIRPVYRTEVKRVTHVAGGKGTNVARALKGMGQPARAFTLLGGWSGRHHAALMEADGLEAVIAWISGETRVSITIVDQHYEQRGYFTPPPVLTPEDLAVVRATFAQALEGTTAVCICGSAPGEEGAALVPEFLHAAAARGIPTLLDTYGEALRQGLPARPTIVKANRKEVSEYLGRQLDTLLDQQEALDELLQAGARWAIITLGEEGALFAAEGKRWMARPPRVQVINPMGSGDAMTAALISALLYGWSPEECFRYGMAAAVANVTSFVPCALSEQEITAMLERIALTPL